MSSSMHGSASRFILELDMGLTSPQLHSLFTPHSEDINAGPLVLGSTLS